MNSIERSLEAWPKVPWLRTCLVLIGALTFGLFALSHGHEFIALDDPDYVSQNPMVNGGFSWPGIRWAFTQYHSSNWHPLTWLSHMLDCQLFGLDAGKQHLVAAAWHALNASLCLLVFVRLSGCLGLSLMIAGLFALHPQRAESVAWISERKDLLAACCFFLTLLAHLHFVRNPTKKWRWLVILGFGCGLLCKPSIIMLPLVLILVDLNPLRPELQRPMEQRRLWFQCKEKSVLLSLALCSALVTILVQGDSGAVSRDAAMTLGVRLANAGSSYVSYVGTTLYPVKLAYFYPHPALIDPSWAALNPHTLGAFALLGVLLVSLWKTRNRWPSFQLGAGWFLILLLPMIGIVQVGEQAYADRYSYLSSIGLYLILCHGISVLLPNTKAQIALGATVLVACSLLTAREIGYWKNSATLFQRAAQVTPNNYAAALGLGNLHYSAGRLGEARIEYEKVLALRPKLTQALYNYGRLEQERGHGPEALALYKRAIEADPSFLVAYFNLGALQTAEGNLLAAIQAFGEVVRREPEGSPPRRQAAINLSQLGREFQTQLGITPRNPELRELLRAVRAALHPEG